jgi:uncharacterized protein YfaA (DUF2138 family)
MAKSRQTLQVRIPLYCRPRNEWRRVIHAAIVKSAKAHAVIYRPNDKLDLIITLYLAAKKIGWHDVDNRLKDIMDALQGRTGGSKSEHPVIAIVPNDHQIYKVTIEKRTPPPQSLGMGHLIIKKHK